jgi:hypothetical protein
MEVGQQYDTIYNSARHNQLLFLLTSVAKTLCENGIMPFLAGQEYSQYARCIFTDGKLYTASRAILANEQPYPTPGDDSGVWIAEETSENLVPNSRRVIAGTGLTGGGPLSSDVTLSAKLDGKTTQAAADGAITVKDVAIGGNLEDLASARGQIGDYRTKLPAGTDLNDIISSGTYIVYSGNCTNVPMNGMDGYYVLRVFGDATNPNAAVQKIYSRMGTAGPEWSRRRINDGTWQPWQQLVQTNYIGDGIKISRSKALADGTGGLCIISVPEMQGATASAAGTSGLVPPAAAGQQESFLTGGGEYKPALGFTPVQQGGGTGQGSDKIYIGYSESGLKAQADTLDLGNVVTTSAGCTKAPSAALADNATNARNLVVTDDGQTAKFNWSGRNTGQPEWVWGGNAAEFGNMYTWNPINFSVNYATNSSNAWQTTIVPNVAFVGRDGAIPNGGTWLYIYIPYDRHYLGGVTLAGGATAPSNEGGIAIRVA